MMYATAWLVLPRLLESATPLCSLSHTWCRTPQAGSFCHKSETPQAESLIDLSHAKFHCSFIRNAFRLISFGRNNVCERIFVIFLHNYVTRIQYVGIVVKFVTTLNILLQKKRFQLQITAILLTRTEEKQAVCAAHLENNWIENQIFTAFFSYNKRDSRE